MKNKNIKGCLFKTEAPSVSTFCPAASVKFSLITKRVKKKLRQQATWADKETVITKEQYQPIDV